MFCSHSGNLNFTGEVVVKDITVIVKDGKILNTKDIEPIKDLLLSGGHFLRAYSDDWERTENGMIYNPGHKDEKEEPKEVKEEIKDEKEEPKKDIFKKTTSKQKRR